MTRARAALVDAREQMPGLLRERPSGSELEAARRRELVDPDSRRELTAATPTNGLSLARVEEIVLNLQEERTELRAEVAALRMISEELRETLVRLDERSLDSSNGAIKPAETAAALIPIDPIFPSGSVGVAVHLAGVEGRQPLEALRAAIAQQPEVDDARAGGIDGDRSLLRVYLRFPLPSRAFLEVLARAAPSAKPLAGPAPGSLLLRLRPG
jgi:hypothetical protein